MSPLHFDGAAAEAWAAFSGDYNPIHFDPQFARRTIGSEGTVVHGMLAMLGLKEAVTRIKWPEGGWLQWTGMLKQAMPSDAPYGLEIKPTGPGSKVRFKLNNIRDQDKPILGNCTEIDFDATASGFSPRYGIAGDELRERLDSFSNHFPETCAAWIAVDALIFSEYIQKHSVQTFREDIIQHFGPQTEIDFGKSTLLTMQTHHRDIFKASLLRDLDTLHLDDVRYDIQKKDVLLTQDSLFATIDMPVWLNGDLSQVVQIGLMARKPLTTSETTQGNQQ